MTFSLRIIAACCLLAQGSQAQSYFTRTKQNGDFYTASNWDLNRIPGINDVVIINNAGTATIAEDAGERSLSSFELGELEDSTDSGHIVMEGGFLRIGESQGDSKIHIGEGTVLSTFVMNGGTIYFDGPDDGALAGSRGSAGVNESDWEIGEHGYGRFEMHGDAVFRAGDDLKISENAAGHGSFLIDGQARLSVGSGIAVSKGGSDFQEMTIGGSAVVDSGNSMGAGNPDGHTDEGYLTLAINGGNARVTVKDQGTLNFRVLSSREGISEFTIQDQGQVHIFDVLAGTGQADGQGNADRPTEVGGFRNSLSSGSNTESTLIIQDQGQMTVNADNGLGISGPRGSSDPGGKALMAVRDSGSFRVEQDLALATGTSSETCEATLEIRGPNASVSIGGNLNMAVDPDGLVPTAETESDGTPIPAKSILHSVITSASHASLQVAGIARIAQGILKVSLDGYAPSGGETYELVSASELDGTFREVDLEAAPLAEGLSWETEYNEGKVLLKVQGQSNGGGSTTSIAVSADGNSLTLSWEGGGSLLSAASILGPWNVVSGASSPYSTTAEKSAQFYRVGNP